MASLFWKFNSNVQSWFTRDDGQDLIEYALVVAMIAFAATAAMSILATDINVAFTGIGSNLNAAIA